MTNPIVSENALPGNTGWDTDQRASTDIEGFATSISINHGETVSFAINTDGAYHIEIYRLGYYGGDGARLVHQINGLVGAGQPEPLSNPATGLVDAGNWAVSAQWAVPADAVSGVYIAKLVRAGGGDAQIPFIVRADESTSDIVFQTSDTTWQAYNSWGANHDALGELGADFYPENGSGPTGPNDIGPGTGSFGAGRAYEVSYNRPIVTRDGGDAAGPWDYLFGAEYAAIYWLEQNGYDVTYISGVDTARSASLLLNHNVFISTGHDEYWSGDQRTNVEAARDAGVNLAFFSGNEVYWRTRWETSYLSDGTPYRTLVCYKETWANGDIDPSNEWTGTWRDPRFVSATAQGGGNPENALTGTIFYVDSFRADAITIPYEMTQLRFWRDTDVADTAPGDQFTLTQNILGYEWDASPDNGFRPESLIPLSSTTINVSQLLLDFGNTVGPGTATHNLTLYRDQQSGALVFGAGTVFWSWGLSDQHDATPTPVDINIQQAMVNLLADMGAQPGSLQLDLVLATASTDVTAPTTTVAIQGNPTSVVEGQVVTITGTATDNDNNPNTDDGRVAAIEVSTDGGATWRVATGTTDWTYTWTATDPGNHTILARAIDDSVNLQSSSIDSVALSVMASPTSQLFSSSDTPAGFFSDGQPVELGVRFQSSVAGSITDLLFYRAPGETGSHEGHLWAADGTLLATFTFVNETASGWQTATLPTPFDITANTTYIASYHANVAYGATGNYFLTEHTSGSLTAFADGAGGGNGVYNYGVGAIFPTLSFDASNYWVDVVFNIANSSPVILSDGGGDTASLSIAENTAAVTDVDATDPEVQAITYSVHGTDAALFGIDPGSGVLTFLSAPNFEAPADAGANNVYDIVVRATDSLGAFDEQTLSVTITPVNEFAPVFGGVDDGDVTEDFDLTDTGTLTVVDQDAGQSALQPATMVDPLGSLTIEADGDWTFTLANASAAVQALSVHQSPDLLFTVHSADGTAHDIAIEVFGSNDAPVLTGDRAATVLEGNLYTLTTADIGFTDVDNGDTEILFHVSSQVNGTVFLNGVAASSFTLQNVIDGDVWFQHDDSETSTASFAVLAEDEEGENSATSTFNLAVTPVNDAPTDIAFAGSLTVNEHTPGSLGILTGIDSDPGESFSYAVSDLRFAIGGAGNNELIVVSAASLDLERDGTSSTTVTVTATSSGGLSVQETFTITIVDMVPDIVTGTSAGEAIFGGNPGSDVINGAGGNDILVGHGGGDFLTGGPGSDLLNGGAGDDTLFFDVADPISAGSISGGSGYDFVHFTGTENVYFDMTAAQVEWYGGGPGNDVVTAAGTAAGVAIWGRAGTDNLAGGSNSDILIGGDGGDTLSGGAGGDALYGSDLTGGLDGSADTFFGGSGGDLLFIDATDAGAGQVFAGPDYDYIHIRDPGGVVFHMTNAMALEWVSAGAGNDTLDGRATTTGLVLHGDYPSGAGNDTLIGGTGSDGLYGGLGNDQLEGGGGTDFLFGGGGADRFVLSTRAGVSYVYDWDQGSLGSASDGLDRIQLGGGLTLANVTITEQFGHVYLAAGDATLVLIGAAGQFDPGSHLG